LEATRRIRANGDDILIIAITANVFKEDVENCRKAGMDDYLAKPVNMEDFIEMVRKYCGEGKEKLE
jgi:CheY-like chemotaxis protein